MYIYLSIQLDNDDEMNVNKQVSLPLEQVQWLNENHISISAFVQEKIAEAMKNNKP